MRKSDEELSMNDVIKSISDEGVFSEDQISALTNYAHEIDNLIRIKIAAIRISDHAYNP